MFTTSHRFSSSLRGLLTNFNNINSHDILIERLRFRFLRSPLTVLSFHTQMYVYTIPSKFYGCVCYRISLLLVSRWHCLSVRVYSVTYIAYFWSETLTFCFISVAMFNNWFCVGVDPDGMFGRKPSVPKDELQDFFTPNFRVGQK